MFCWDDGLLLLRKCWGDMQASIKMKASRSWQADLERQDICLQLSHRRRGPPERCHALCAVWRILPLWMAVSRDGAADVAVQLHKKCSLHVQAGGQAQHASPLSRRPEAALRPTLPGPAPLCLRPRRAGPGAGCAGPRGDPSPARPCGAPLPGAGMWVRAGAAGGPNPAPWQGCAGGGRLWGVGRAWAWWRPARLWGLAAGGAEPRAGTWRLLQSGPFLSQVNAVRQGAVGVRAPGLTARVSCLKARCVCTWAWKRLWLKLCCKAECDEHGRLSERSKCFH